MPATESSRAIFITGAASGIGRETALLFAGRGWNVGAYDLDEAGLDSLRSEIGGATIAATLDVREPQAYAERLAEFEERFGRLDVLFNCAGIMQMGAFEEADLEAQLRTVDVNCKGVLIGTRLALDLLKRTPGSNVLSMCSASAIYGVPDLATYSASKFFVRGLTESLNLELERHGIWVTDLMPLYVATPMVSNQTHEAGTLKTFGAKLTPQGIAELAWRAVHRRKVHWMPGWLVKSLSYAGGALPFLSRPTMGFLSRR